MAKRKYNTRKKRSKRLRQMMFCEKCGAIFFPTLKYPYACMMCGSIDPRRQHGKIQS